MVHRGSHLEMDQFGREDHSYAPTRLERERYDTQLVVAQSCSMPNIDATQLRGDFDQMHAEFRKVKDAAMTGDKNYSKLFPRVLQQQRRQRPKPSKHHQP